MCGRAMPTEDRNDRGNAGTGPSGLRRLAAIIPARDISGAARQLIGPAKTIIARGGEVTLVVPSRPDLPIPPFAVFARENGVPCRVMVDRSALDLQLLRELRAFIADWQPDIVETHGYKATGLMYLLRKLGMQVPWLGYFHGTTDLGLKDRIYHRLDMAMLGSADRIVVPSRRQVGLFGKAEARTRVIHTALPDDEAGQPVVRAGVEGRAPVLGVVGRLSREKGVDVFLDTLARLALDGRPFKAVIAGAGPARAELEAKAAQLGLGERVSFLGHVAAMDEVYRTLDVLVIPSRSEGLPNVLLEAMRHGIAVAATDVGAMPEVLDVAPGAFRMVPAENPAALADGILRAIEDISAAHAITARAAAAAAFSLSGRMARLDRLYGEVLGSPSIRPA